MALLLFGMWSLDQTRSDSDFPLLVVPQDPVTFRLRMANAMNRSTTLAQLSR